MIINSVKTLRREFHKSCQYCIRFVVVLYDALYYVIWFDAVTMAIAGRKAENSSRREPILCASLLHGQYIHILVICQILAELMCFEDVIINLMGGQRQAKCGMSKIACYIDYYKVTSSIR